MAATAKGRRPAPAAPRFGPIYYDDRREAWIVVERTGDVVTHYPHPTREVALERVAAFGEDSMPTRPAPAIARDLEDGAARLEREADQAAGRRRRLKAQAKAARKAARELNRRPRGRPRKQ